MNNNHMLSGSRKVSGHRLSAAGLAACLAFSVSEPEIAGNFLLPPAFAETADAEPVDGGQLYNTYCAVCHKSGLNAAPKYTSKILWGKVVAKGKDKVYENAINGVRGMPPRGGIATLTDEQVKAATDYMVNGSGGWGGN